MKSSGVTEAIPLTELYPCVPASCDTDPAA